MTFPLGKDVLFIDIDDTITRGRTDCPPASDALVPNQTLLSVMHEMAVHDKGTDGEEAEKIIQRVYKTMRWWHWTDFLRALDLDAHAFWQFAYEKESQYLEPVSENLPAIFEALFKADYRMFITSNNPSSGILHKLRVAGLADNWGSRYFLQYLGATELQAMKNEPEYWRRALAHTGLPPDQIITVGDNWAADIDAPFSAGITTGICLGTDGELQLHSREGVHKVRSWDEIAQLLLGKSLSSYVVARKPARKCPPSSIRTC